MHNPDPHMYDELKKKLRRLKKLEAKLRFAGGEPPRGAGYVWDTFFDLHATPSGKAKYSIHRLNEMPKEQFHDVIGEFFFSVYYRLYRESGLADARLFEPEILGFMGLPYDADITDIKKRFHVLALKYHPDTGGDAERFMDLMEKYRKLITKGD